MKSSAPSESLDEAGNAIISYDKMDADVKYLKDKLIEYQTLLNSKKIKDERVRKIEFQGPMPRWVIFTRMVQTVCWHCFCFVVLPRAYHLGPVMVLDTSRRAKFACKGSRWNDSVAEMKMLYGFVHPRFGGNIRYFCHLRALLLPVGLWLTIRFYEDGVAAARSFYSLYKLLFLYKTTMEKCEVCGRSASVW